MKGISYMKSYRLEFIVFLCGATVMVFELVGTRVLAPHLGTSTFVWTSLIGVILGSLSIGYWTGGRIADRKSEWEVLAGIIFLAAAIIGISTFMREIILDLLDLHITDIRWASALASILLFAPASILLGMVSPYAVKLKSRKVEEIGTTVGDLYAFSTVGSIIGTFLAGFYLIPRFGTNNILIMISLSLTAIAIIALPKRAIQQQILMLLLSLMIITCGSYQAKKYDVHNFLADVDTEYSRVQILDTKYRKSLTDKGVAVRLLRMGNTTNSGIYRDNDDLFLQYTRFFRLARYFRPDVKNSLMIGGGAFVYPMDFIRVFPNASMDVVEIDSGLTDLALKYFRFHHDPRLRIINEDGRTFINRSRGSYEVIFCDAFSSYYSIPYQLTTLESVKHLYRLLGDDGVVIINIISAIEGDDGRFLRAEYATFRKVFQQVYLFPVRSPDNGRLIQNIMLVGIKGEKAHAMSSKDPELESYLNHLWKKNVPLDLPILTDDFAPVDHYIGLHA